MQHRLNPNKFLYLRSFFREVEAQYETICNHNTCNDYSTQLVAIDLSNYTRLIENIASKLQSGELKPSDLDASLVEQIYKDVSEPVKEVFKNKWINYDYKEPGSLIQKFKKNLWQFSAAKTLAELEYINGLLLDKNGRIRPEHQFMQEVKKANILFNRNYLQAEYQTAKRGAQMAHLWAKFQEQKHLYPNLMYRTVGDSRVRPEHAVLNGVVKPIDDPFWKTYYPPNGWRCRCTVMNTAQEVSKGEFEDKTVKPEFYGNTALDEEILTSKGSFFKLLNKDHKAKQNAELLKYNMPLEIAYHGKNRKKIFVSPYADEKDLTPNVESAMIIVDSIGVDVKIRAHIAPAIIKKHKNPEYEINGRIGDGTHRVGNIKNFIGNSFIKLKEGEQLYGLKETFIVADCGKISNLSNKEFKAFASDVYNKMKVHYTVKELYIIHNKKAIVITQSDIKKGLSYIKTLIKDIKTQ
ncbi:phage head morphogenesis protein [Riemerella anatipestifer]|uniref:phage head morphogenesis protein n=1 Tax=Riemerella anatipestifer TaxID=34085 RepID=UPI00129E252F|nr:phage minor head protein [Riemerella anatipestifer]MRM84524.1 hypothetical protein [Riemerella anatipestifer]WPC13598.1 phage head morphogenesis protein [Riemerella anatipestifer]